jgi:hypothetical protein
VLLDFCEAGQPAIQRLISQAGTLEYMAPEVLSKPTDEEVFHEVRPGISVF